MHARTPGCVFGELLEAAPVFPGTTDIEQLALVISVLGTPTPSSWPEMTGLPDFGKVLFDPAPGVPWAEVFPRAPPVLRALLGALLQYDPCRRPTASEVCIRQPVEWGGVGMWRHGGLRHSDALPATRDPGPGERALSVSSRLASLLHTRRALHPAQARQSRGALGRPDNILHRDDAVT